MAARKKQNEETTLDEELSTEERRAGDVEIEIPDEEDDDSEEVEDVAPKPSRKERRAARGKLHEEAERLREELAAKDRELAETRAQRAEAAGYVQGLRQAQPGPDPLQARLEAIRAEQTDLMDTFNALPPDQQQKQVAKMRARAQQLREAEYFTLSDIRERSRAPDPRQTQEQENLRLFQARYPDLVQDQASLRWANGRYQQLVAEGAPEGWETIELAMGEARARKNPGKQQPSPTLGRKLQAQPKGAGAAPGGGNRVILSKKDQEMADVYFDKEPDAKKRLQMYAKMIAKGNAQKSA